MSILSQEVILGCPQEFLLPEQINALTTEEAWSAVGLTTLAATILAIGERTLAPYAVPLFLILIFMVSAAADEE